MDKRSWPWKKKSSDKQAAEKTAGNAADSSAGASDIVAAQADKVRQDNNKKPKYVQLSMESYTHLTGLEEQVKSYEEQVKSYEEQVNSYEEQVKTLEDEVKELSDELSEAHSEMINKENLVKQHAKVAEEAVSGWEKAEAEAAALKNQLESVTLLKLTAEDRASHLDGALKECMREIHNLKEEHDQELRAVVLNKTTLFDKMKHDLESKIANLDQELMMSAAENSSLSRSLQERSNMLIKLSEEKSQAEAEIQRLRSNIESREKEVNSLKYEVHIVRKEMEIRNEEKNMSVRSAEVANKQHLEGVKKITKLEAECQRLRGLVRKKLPGPAALAQMKLEVENMGRDYNESRVRRSPGSPSTPHFSQMPDFSLDNAQKSQKENELLTERLLTMEEETKMLKEALAKRNNELQASRSVYAQTASKLQSLELQMQQKIPARSNSGVPVEGFFSQKASTLPSFTSLSEDGNDDNVSCAGSCATVVMSDVSNFKKEKNVDSPHKSENSHQLDLMDDFLEMEKLAYSSNEPNDNNVSNLNLSSNNDVSLEVITNTDSQSGGQNGPARQLSSKDVTVAKPQLREDLSKLQSRISMSLESISKEKDVEKVIGEIRHIMQDMQDALQTLPSDGNITDENGIHLSEDGNSSVKAVKVTNKELEDAISQIFDFVTVLGKEAKSIPTTFTKGDELTSKVNTLSAKYDKSINSKTNLIDFVVDVSHVLSEASELHFNILGIRTSEVETETGISDCIDKIALPENKIVVDSSGEKYSNGCVEFSDSASDPDVPNDNNLVPTSESRSAPWKCSFEEFEQLRTDKDKLTVDLARCTENFESTKSQLVGTEQLLAEMKSQLISAQKSNSLAETQLKCMAESYKSLETRAEELQTEINLLQGKIESLDNELEEEKRNHQDSLTRCKDLQEKLERIGNCGPVDNDVNPSQEKEYADAAEKLAECQETIFLLGKQLKAMRPQTDSLHPQNNERTQTNENSIEEEPTTISDVIMQENDPSEMDSATSFNLHRTGSSSSSNIFNASFIPSDSEANNLLRSPVASKQTKLRPTKSGSSSASPTPTPEKQARGISRFFSSKGKNGIL